MHLLFSLVENRSTVGTGRPRLFRRFLKNFGQMLALLMVFLSLLR